MIKYLSKLFDYTDEEKSAISNAINRQNKEIAKQNIEYMQKANVPYGYIGRIIKEEPLILTLDPNPNNPNSLEYKYTFYQKYGVSKLSLLCSPKLCLYDVYKDSNTYAVLNSLLLIGLNNNQIGKVITKCPKILGIDSADESINGLHARLNFWREIANDAEVDFAKLIMRSPHLLGYSINPADPDSIVNKFAYFKQRFNINDKTLATQIYKFPNFVGLDIDETNESSVDAKAKKLNELGLSDQIIGGNLKILGAPINKVKLRYIICKNFGMSDSVFINNKFMIAESKLYARAMYLNANKYPRSLIYGTEAEFALRTGKHISDIVLDYPLDESAALREEQIYNANHKRQIRLNPIEIQAINPNPQDNRSL